ncbi:sugar ABC transporter substrate-binding protein [Ruminococcaceae bacterium OttesenSCG-928-A16]|nr:sugar ABC transporter substrate-binding protein [Ruminococcaceae bacterium OttesenSCG-928-A16]
MKKSRFLALVLSVLMAASVLAACGGSGAGGGVASAPANGASGAAAGSTAPSGNPVNIVWAGWSGEEEASKEIFGRMRGAYEAESGNSVTWVGWTWADTAQQLLIRTQGSEQLDIAQVDIGIFNTLAQAGVLADVSEILGQGYLDSTFEASALEVGNVDGQQLAIPWSMASISMVYNPEILAQAGWDTVPATVEEFEKCLADIKALGGDVIPYAVSTKDATSAGDFMPWLWTFGGAIYGEDGSVTINSEAAIECIKWYQGMLEKGYIAMDTGRGEARQMFAQGKVAFYDDAVVAKGQAVSNGVAPQDVVNVCSAMERPVLKAGDTPQSTMWGHMLVVFKGSEYKEQAAELAKTLISDEVAMDYFTNNGMPPVTKSLITSDAVKSDAYLNGFMQSTATASLEETARMANASEVKTIITEELQAALLGQKTAEQAAANMESRLKAL